MAFSGTRLSLSYISRHIWGLQASLPVVGYKSAVSLGKIYPSSDLCITTLQTPPKTEGLNFSGYVPMDRVQVSYSRSSGPGGQNVNKINTKVDLRFHVTTADWLSQELKERIAEKYKSRVTVDGYLVIRSDKTRSQQLNLADAMDKLRHMIHTAAHVQKIPPAEAEERARRRHEASVRERLRYKKAHSLIKQGRQNNECD
nr:peptidyl-tRNA hydrolase ICT1, mitochondrial-like [Procambarus clarkii]